MSKGTPLSRTDLKHLATFLSNNRDTDFILLNLQDPDVQQGFNWSRTARHRESVLSSLQAYQRLLRIMPGPNRELILQLLQEGFHSALQVAAVPGPVFTERFVSHFGGDPALAARCHANAVAVKNRVLLRFMEARQRNEPHASQTNLSRRL